jgi:hypothetical protein
MRTGVVLGMLLALTAAGIVVTLSLRGERAIGTNGMRPSGLVVTVPAGATACQPDSPLPSGTGSVALVVSANRRPTPPLRVRFLTAGGRVVAAGGLAGGRREGRLTVPLARGAGGGESARVCVQDRGRVPIMLGGGTGVPAVAARVAGGSPQGVVALSYLRSGREAWWPLLGGIAHRFGLGKASLFGGWTLWAAAAALLCLWAVTSWLLWSERPR